jgi:hypothetical protein
MRDEPPPNIAFPPVGVLILAQLHKGQWVGLAELREVLNVAAPTAIEGCKTNDTGIPGSAHVRLHDRAKFYSFLVRKCPDMVDAWAAADVVDAMRKANPL